MAAMPLIFLAKIWIDKQKFLLTIQKLKSPGYLSAALSAMAGVLFQTKESPVKPAMEPELSMLTNPMTEKQTEVVMTNKKSFILYTDIYEAIKTLPITEKGNLLDSIFQFVINGKENILKPETKMAFNFIKTSLLRDAQKWEDIRLRNITNGKKGGRPRLNNKPRKPSGLFGNPKNPVSANASVNAIAEAAKKNAGWEEKVNSWNVYGVPYLTTLNVHDPVFKETVRVAFMEKAITASERTVRGFIDQQLKTTPPKKDWRSAYD